MPPRKQESSVPGLLYPSNRDQLIKTSIQWLKAKALDDGAEGLWRIHNKLYDLNKFAKLHPGGSDWILATQGTDITEAFESAHISQAPERLLNKYYVREASQPRAYPYTFDPDGFYNTLKKKARDILKDKPNKPSTKLLLITDGTTMLFLLFFLASCIFRSYLLAVITGIVLGHVCIIAHNFFHQKDNWRMYVFDFSCLSSFEWRISHGLSHHLFPNTMRDIEISALEPLIELLPGSDISLQSRWLRVLFLNFMLPIFFILELLKRLYGILSGEQKLRWENTFPFLALFIMYCIVNDFWSAFSLWLTIQCSTSYWFGAIGLVAAHHHPNIFHDGDTPRKETDWGLWQLDAVRDRHDVTGSLFLVATMFGDHTLHHLFPTLNHSLLEDLYPALYETCREFGIPWKMYSWWELYVGKYRQLLRTEPNKEEPWVAESKS